MSIERLRGSNSDEYNEEDEEIELEIVEVEELDEPVPTQDSCLQVSGIQHGVDRTKSLRSWPFSDLIDPLRVRQVTEEDIAFCMGELENPLPEVDQEEHPLRVLSQENMTVVSTFTGMYRARRIIAFRPCMTERFRLFVADSLSVANDIERVFSRPGGGNGFGQFNHHGRLQSAPQHERKSSKGMIAAPYTVTLLRI